MAPRAVGTATIAFGLVNIPVKLFSAANPSSAISFRLLSKDGHKLKQQYIDPKDEDRVVPRSEMVKGYEFAKDQFVLFEEAELKEMQEKATGAIDIQEFVPEEKVPKVYYAKTYYRYQVAVPDDEATHCALARELCRRRRVARGIAVESTPGGRQRS
ncbi:MAG: Ku protein, partial [Myxococcota bacterium]